MESIKTFKDLEFEMHPILLNAKLQDTKEMFANSKRAVMEFENGYGISVVFGDIFYSNGIDTYEVAILKEGSICYDTYITDDVVAYITEDEVTEIMRKVQELAQNSQLHKHSVMEGDFFILSSEKGYTPSQRKEAMQVMECCDKVMTVKCKGGCMTKEYDHFEKVTDLSGFRSVHRYYGEMEDRRSCHPA